MKMTVHSEAVERRLSRASKHLFGALDTVMERIGRLLKKETEKNLNNKLLKVRSGRLLHSINYKVLMPPKKVTLEVFSRDVPYARIQNYGGRAGRNHAARIKPTYYMSKTIEDKRKQINRLIHNALKKALR